MCNNCEDTSIILPVGNPGVDGPNGVATNGIAGVEEKVSFDTTLNLTYTVNQFTETMPLLSDGLTYDLNAYREIGSFIFPGTKNLNGQNPNIALLVVNTTGITQWQISLKSNNLVIAETSSFNLPVDSLIYTFPISTLPSDVSIMTIEVRPLTNRTNDTLNIKALMLIKF